MQKCTQRILEDAEQSTPDSKRQKLADGGKSQPNLGKIRGKRRHHVFPDVKQRACAEMVSAVYCLAASPRYSKASNGTSTGANKQA
jgi:hypothetical protein